MDAGPQQGKTKIKSDINVTPLVDIVLVLLIIFIVITPAVNNSVKLPLAKHSPRVVKEQGAKYLTLFASALRNDKGEVIGMSAITIDDNAAKDLKFDLSNPEQELKLIDFININVSALNDKRVFVKADADLPYKDVNKVFQAARKAGADEASIVTGEEKEVKKEGGQ